MHFECLEFLRMNEKIEFAKKMEKRTLQFAINITQFSARLGNNTENKVIKNQITKSGSSIGANYRLTDQEAKLILKIKFLYA